MNAVLTTGMVIVVFAFGSYTTAIISQARRHRPTALVRGFLTAGVAFDATATGFMIAGSRKIPLTFHGVLGYSAFLLMATDLALIWRSYRVRGTDPLPTRLHCYSMVAYSWWVLAFVAGMIVTLTLK